MTVPRPDPFVPDPIGETATAEEEIDPHRSDRVGRSFTPRLVLGAAIGAVLGGLVGLAVGLVAFEAASPGMWASIVAGAVFGLLVGAFWGGMSGLGPPAEDDDPLPRRAGDRSGTPRSRVVE